MDPSLSAPSDTAQSALTPGSTSYAVHPSFSPLYPPAINSNTRILSTLSTLTSIFSGCLAGILGLTNLSGFGAYLVGGLINAVVTWVINGRSVAGRSGVVGMLPGLNMDQTKVSGGGGKLSFWTVGKVLWSLSAIGQESLLTFLLFWIGLYVSVAEVVTSQASSFRSSEAAGKDGGNGSLEPW